MPTEIDYIQQSFSGGLNQMVDSTRINRNEYPLLINGRSRYDAITNIRLPRQINDIALTGANYQGIYAALNYIFMFVDGQPYVKDMNYPDSAFAKVGDIALDATVPVIYAELVPGSYSNFQRSLLKTNNNRNTDVLLGNIIDPTPQALIAQDGKTQPLTILSTNQTRLASKYAEWSLDNREYVPVMRQMLYHGGILYGVSPDGKRIFRSVTGRGMDFMVNIQPGDAGDRWPDEQDGSANTVSFAVDYDEITSLNRLNTDDNSFFVSTKKTSYAITPLEKDVDLVFGEPTFRNRFLFSAGSISPFGFVELLGDNAFQDFNGLRSFNAIMQIKNEGSNSPFSKKLGPIIQGIQQDYVAATTFDNYALFACNTIYGRGIIIYDTLSETFVGIDLYPNVGQIKQFAEVKADDGKRYLFFITTDNKFYQAYDGLVSTPQLYVGEWCSNDPKLEQKISQLKLVFIDCKSEGEVTASAYIDRRLNKTLRYPLAQKTNNETNATPIVPPFGTSTIDNVQIIPFDFGRSKQGWKAGFFITWDVEATLSHIGLVSSSEPNISSVETQAKAYKRNLAAMNEGAI